MDHLNHKEKKAENKESVETNKHLVIDTLRLLYTKNVPCGDDCTGKNCGCIGKDCHCHGKDCKKCLPYREDCI